MYVHMKPMETSTKQQTQLKIVSMVVQERGTLLTNHLTDSLHKKFPVLLQEPMHHTGYGVLIQPSLQRLAL